MSALRELIASFGFEVDTSALEAADGATAGVVEGLKDLGKGVIKAFAVEKVFEFGKELLEQADVLAKQSSALGISAEELQGWEHAAQLSGSSAEEFTAAFTKFTRNVNEASESAGGPAAKAFKTLGVSIKDSSGKLGAPIDLLDGVVAGLQNIEDPAKRTAVVMDLFGKSGARLLPLLSEGPEGLKKLRAEVGELGATFDSAFLENAQEVNDNVDRLKLGLRGLAIQVIGPMLPGLVRLSQGAIAVAKTFIGWIKQTTLAQGLVGSLAVKGLPVLISGLRTLGSVVLRTVLPFLILDDAIGFLTGDDSLLGEALDKIFGSGTAEAARAEILTWFTNVKNVVVNDLLPALKGITESALFKGVAKGALDAILAVLQAIGLALTDDEERATKLAKSLQAHLASLGLAPSEDEVKKQVEQGLPENQKPGDRLSPTEAKVRGVFTSIFGDPMDDPVVKAETEKNRKLLEKRRLDQEGVVASPSLPPLPQGEVTAAFKPDAFGPPTAPDYAAAFRPTVASAPVGTPTTVNDNSVKTVAPETHVHVTVAGGTEAEVGNRVGRAAVKAAGPINTRVITDALVPTPGG